MGEISLPRLVRHPLCSRNAKSSGCCCQSSAWHIPDWASRVQSPRSPSKRSNPQWKSAPDGLDVVFLLGALNNELFAISARSQVGVSTLIVNLDSLQLFAGDREGTGDCIVANGDLLTIHIRECIPPPLYPLGSAKAAIGSDDTVITTVIAPIAQRFSHGLLIYLLSCCVASI